MAATIDKKAADPHQEKVYIYREHGENETVSGFAGKKLTDETPMPGMDLPLEE